jgi:hypothetical protein
MPHYVTRVTCDVQYEEKGPIVEEDRYYIYSTIVDGSITQLMTESVMYDWLKEKEYSFWLDPEGHKLDADRMQGMWWNGWFWHTYEEDCIYNLPRNMWQQV